MIGDCRSCGSAEPLNANFHCEDCADEIRREARDLDDTHIGWDDDDDDWGEEP